MNMSASGAWSYLSLRASLPMSGLMFAAGKTRKGFGGGGAGAAGRLI